MAPIRTKPKAQQSVKETFHELDMFAQVSRRLFQDPRWSGKKVPGAAWRVLCWMIVKTTRNFEIDGVNHGEVDYGKPITFMPIATDLQCSWSQVKRASKWLVDNKFLSRGKTGFSGGYRWSVLNSTRKFKAEAA
jgi:hypothetical protein